MKRFKCSYETANGVFVGKDCYTKIESESPEEAALIYAQSHPSEHRKIVINWGFSNSVVIDNPLHEESIKEKQAQAQVRQEQAQAQARQEQAQAQARQEMVRDLSAILDACESGLSGLSYHQITALVANLRDFPYISSSLEPEEYAVREELYKLAFFEPTLQAALQTELLNKLNIAVGNQPSSGAAKGSNVATKAAMLGGAAALMKLNQISQDVNEISEDVSEVSEGFGFD